MALGADRFCAQSGAHTAQLGPLASTRLSLSGGQSELHAREVASCERSPLSAHHYLIGGRFALGQQSNRPNKCPNV